MPGLFAFAYPVTGRGLVRIRRAALVLWTWLFGHHFDRLDSR
jgi:hypothetical protein